MSDSQQRPPHIPVLVNEVLTFLAPQPHKTYLDVTFGAGGHTRAILNAEPHCCVIVMDWDRVSLETYFPPLQEEFGNRVSWIWGNFGHLYKLLKKAGVNSVAGILADFGTSSMHIHDRAGFSFTYNTPLDMRMSPAHNLTTAATIVNEASAQELEHLFFEFGQEPHTRKIVREIVAIRARNPIATTKELADIVVRIIPRHGRIHPATRIFQALRIAVNKELENIRSFLPAALQALELQGRLVCISFHSLEDRIVKQFARESADAHYVKILTKKVVIASAQERATNPSARSAKLRAVELIVPYKDVR